MLNLLAEYCNTRLTAMTFDILEYFDEIEHKLGQLVVERRVVFSAWCCQPLWDGFSDYLAKRIGNDQAIVLSAALDRTWTQLADSNRPTGREIQAAKALCLSADWSTPETNEAFANYGAVQLIGGFLKLFEVIETGSAKSAARTAEYIINRVDYELSMLAGVNDPLSHPRLRQELQVEDHMLKYLGETRVITLDDRRRFR